MPEAIKINAPCNRCGGPTAVMFDHVGRRVRPYCARNCDGSAVGVAPAPDGTQPFGPQDPAPEQKPDG